MGKDQKKQKPITRTIAEHNTIEEFIKDKEAIENDLQVALIELCTKYGVNVKAIETEIIWDMKGVGIVSSCKLKVVL